MVDTRSRLTVVVYDVSDNRRRTRLHRVLKRYGIASQLSAFEARLDRSERQELLAAVRPLIDPAQDRFIMYVIGPADEARIECLGRPRPRIVQEDYYIV